MKTTLMGLIAHPFSNDTKDAFGIPLKTNLGDVFKLSKKYDDEYSYNVCFTSTKNEKIKETVNIDVVGDRHRIVVSGHGKGDGNFIFNTSFHNLGRLNPIVETSANEKENISLTDEEQQEFFTDNPDFMQEFPICRDKIYLLRDPVFRGILRRIREYEGGKGTC